MDYALRFFIGGFVVSFFNLLGDVLHPKSFAGLFGAAPSVALGTLALAFYRHGGDYVAIEGRSMVIGAVALGAYSVTVCQLLSARIGRRFGQPLRRSLFGWLWRSAQSNS